MPIKNTLNLTLTLTLLLSLTPLQAQLSGELRVNPNGSGNYTTIQAAISALESQGISGPVTLSIAPGTYPGTIDINEIQGTSPQNRITITSSTGKAEDVQLVDTLSDPNNFLNAGHIRIFHTDYLTFSHLTIKSVAENILASAFTSFGGTDFLEINNCSIITEGMTVYGIFSVKSMGEDFQYSDLGPENLTLYNNTIEGNIYFSIINNEFRTKNLSMINNRITGEFVNISDYENLRFENNEFQNPEQSSGTGVLLYNLHGENVVSGNLIKSKNVALELTLIASEIKVFNNFLISDYIGMSIGSDDVECYHNNMYVSGNSPLSSAVNIVSGENNIFRNNIFAINSKGAAVSFPYDPALDNNTFDYNNYYAPAGFLWQNVSNYPPAGVTDLSAIQTNFQSELNGLNVNPIYLSPDDLHVNNGALKDVGQPIEGITTDFDGELRDPLLPDIGADEMSLPANLRITSVAISPTITKGKDSISVSWTAVNDGGSDLQGNWTDHVYVSSDRVLDPADQKLGEFIQADPLPIGQSYTFTREVEFEETTDGDWFFIVFVNAENQQGEGNSEDNILNSNPLSYKARERSSLFVSEINAPSQAPSGTEIIIQWKVTNTGQIPTSDTWYDFVYISRDSSYLENPSLFNPDSLIIAKVKNVAGLDVGESYSSSLKYALPLRGSGKIYAKVVPDGANKIDEIVENPAQKSVTSEAILVSQTPLADLVITEVNIPSTAFSGDLIPFSYTIKNIGNAPTSKDRRLDHIYLLNDSVAADGDFRDYIRFKDLYITGEILPDSSRIIQSDFYLPFCQHGTYFFYFHTDARKIVYEFSDDNNGFETTDIEVVLKPNPDFIIENLQIAPPTPASDANLSIGYEVKNDGFDSASIFNNLFEGLWLSRDEEWNEESAILSQKPIDFDTLYLEVGESLARTRSMFIPDSVYGTFYLFVRADNGEKFCEFPFEDNNLKRFGPFTINRSPSKDLQITNPKIPMAAEAGAKINVGYSLENKGKGAILRKEIKDSLAFFNAKDTIYLYANKKERSLPPGGSVQEDLLLTIPYKIPPGNYSLAFITDTENRVYEHEAEGNNRTIVSNISIIRNPDNLAELEITNVSLASVEAGKTMTINYTVRNTSERETPVNFWTDRAVFTDPHGKVVLETLSTGTQVLGKNESYSRALSLNIPIKMFGQYKLTIMTDTDYQVQEYDDENNIFKQVVDIPLSAWADLEVTGFSFPSTLTAGQEASFDWTVKNSGSRTTERNFWIDKIYLSENNVLNGSDIEIYKLPYEEFLAQGSSYTKEEDFRIPAHISGEYFLILSVNDNRSIFENGSEQNNLYISPTPITVYRPAPVDLEPVIQNIYFNGNQVTYQIHNRGNNPVVGSWIDAYFLSTDQTWDPDDKLLGYNTIRPGADILPGAFIEADYSRPLPQVRPGDYYVLVKSDVFNYVPETDLSNNTASPATPVFVDNIADLEDGVPTDTIFRFNNRNHFYQLEKPAGKGILLTLEGQGTSPITDLFYRTDDLPTSGGKFDYRGNNPLQTNQRIIVPSVDTATEDFILAEADYLDSDWMLYSILAEQKDFSLVDVFPKKGGMHGIVVLDLEGFDFSDSITVYLRNEIDTTKAIHSYLVEPTLARAHLNLNDLSPGLYDVVLKRNDRGDETSLEEIFIVEDTVYQEYYVEVVAPSDARINREFDIQVNYANFSNINDYDMFLFVSFYRADFKVDSFEVEYVGDGISDKIQGEAGRLHATGKNVFITDDKAYHFIAWIPVFASQGRGQFSFKLRGQVEDTIYINTQYFRNDISRIHFTGNLDDLKYSQFVKDMENYLDGNYGNESTDPGSKKSGPCVLDPEKVEAMIWKGVRSHAEYVSGGIPGNPTAVVATLLQESLKSYIDPDAHTNAKDMAKDLTDERREIVLNPTEKSAYDHLIKNLDNCLTPELVDEVMDKCVKRTSEQYIRENGTYGTRYVYTNTCPKGGDKGGGKNNDKGKTSVNRPRDPNDIIGPEGKGSPRFITPAESLPYKIRFENVSTATAPALRVDIENALDSSFNLKQFRLDKIGWGDTIIQLPQKSYFSGDFDLGPRYSDHRLRLVAGVDAVNRRAFWNFSTIDPLTGAPPADPGAGFLPPNDSTGIGEGFVSYFIMAEKDSEAGTLLPNQAVIIFDEEESLETNTWINTLVGEGTESFVEELPPTTDTTRFVIGWDYLGFQAFSPVPVKYSVFVATNEGSYEKWINSTTETSAIFTGETGSTYYFFSIAEFSDGSFEAAPDSPDAYTTIVESTNIRENFPNSEPLLTVYPNPSGKEMNLNYILSENGPFSIDVFDLAGKKLLTIFQDQKPAGNYSFSLEDTPFLEKGIYLIRLEQGARGSFVKWVKR